jgi:hypothetical protein
MDLAAAPHVPDDADKGRTIHAAMIAAAGRNAGCDLVRLPPLDRRKAMLAHAIRSHGCPAVFGYVALGVLSPT